MTPTHAKQEAPRPPKLMLIGPGGEVAGVAVGPGLELANTPDGGIVLRAKPRPPVATVTNVIARVASDGSYPLPEAVKGAIPQQIAHLTAYRDGVRLRPLIDYVVEIQGQPRLVPVNGSLGDEVILDYVATY